MPEQLTADERLGVFDLIADYADRLESGDLDGYLETFTPDGVFEVRGARYEGREAIRALVTHLYEIDQDGPTGNRHILGLPAVRGTAEGCAARTYVMITTAGARPAAPIHTIAQYHDRIVWRDGRWRFAHRHILPVVDRQGSAR